MNHDIIDNRKQKLVDHTVALLTVERSQVRPPDPRDIPHARELQAGLLPPAADTSALEWEIDQRGYALYLPEPSLRQAGGLTPEEIKIVESASVQTSARQGNTAK